MRKHITAVLLFLAVKVAGSSLEDIPLMRTIFYMYECTFAGNQPALAQISRVKSEAEALGREMKYNAMKLRCSSDDFEFERPDLITAWLRILESTYDKHIGGLSKLAYSCFRLHYYRALIDAELEDWKGKMIVPHSKPLALLQHQDPPVGYLRSDFEFSRQSAELEMTHFDNPILQLQILYSVAISYLNNYQRLLHIAIKWAKVGSDMAAQLESLFNVVIQEFDALRWKSFTLICPLKLKEMGVRLLVSGKEETGLLSVDWHLKATPTFRHSGQSVVERKRHEAIRSAIAWHNMYLSELDLFYPIFQDRKKPDSSEKLDIRDKLDSRYAVKWAVYNNHHLYLKYLKRINGLPCWIDQILDRFSDRLQEADRVRFKHYLSTLNYHFTHHTMNIICSGDRKNVGPAIGYYDFTGKEGAAVESEYELFRCLQKMGKYYGGLGMHATLFMQDLTKILTRLYKSVTFLSAFGLWVSVDKYDGESGQELPISPSTAYWERMAIHALTLNSSIMEAHRSAKVRKIGVEAIKSIFTCSVAVLSRWRLLVDVPRLFAFMDQMAAGVE